MQLQHGIASFVDSADEMHGEAQKEGEAAALKTSLIIGSSPR